MLTTFSLWGIYFASYLIDYILILVIYIMKQVAQTDEVVRWKTDDFLIVGILIVFVVAAILITFYMRHMKPNTRIKAVPDRNITYEMAGGLLAQVTAVATTIYSDWWIPINLVLFVTVGVFFVKSKNVHMSPLFVFPLCNKVFQSDKYVFITNYTLQEMKIAQEDNPDGLEARELTNRIYYVRK